MKEVFLYLFFWEELLLFHFEKTIQFFKKGGAENYAVKTFFQC